MKKLDPILLATFIKLLFEYLDYNTHRRTHVILEEEIRKI